MDVNRFANLNTGSVGGVKPSQAPVLDRSKGVQGPSFEQTLQRLQSQNPSVAAANPLEKANPLVFSKHAVERMNSRGIGLGADGMNRLERAFDKANEKGSRNTLVLMDNNAFIMSVKNKTIVTAMDQANLKENLFTNIDSTIIV